MTHRLVRCVWVLAMTPLLGGCDALISVEQRLERARLAIATGDIGRAAIELRKVVRDAPENAGARLLLAQTALAAGDASGAQSEIKRAVQAGASGPELDALRIETWLAANEPGALVEALTRGEVTIAEPARSLALGRARNALGQPDAALAAFATVLSADGRSTPARLGRAEALVLRGESDQALREIDEIIQTDAKSAAAPSMKGRILLRRGQFAQAQDALHIARERSGHAARSERAVTLAASIEASLGEGKLNDAIATHAELAKLLPDAGITRLLGARVALAAGDYAAGIGELQRIVVAAPDFVIARMLLGAAHVTQGNYLQAESQLAAVVQSSPENLEARKLLARVRLHLDQPEAALSVLTPAVDAEAADPQLYALLGVARTLSGDPSAALETLEYGVRANPASHSLKLDLAAAYIAAGRPGEAIALLGTAEASDYTVRHGALFIAAVNAERGPRAAHAEVEKLLAKRPRDVAVLNLAASYFAAQWEFDRARALLDAALAIDARSVPTLVNLARVQGTRNDSAAAESSIRRALSIEDNNIPVRVALADLLARRGEWVEARKTLESGVQKSSSTELQFAIARLELARGDVAAASAALDLATASQPNHADLASRAGLTLLEGRQYGAALARFRKATELAPKNPAYWLNTARAQLALNEVTAARESIEQALALRPDWVPAVGARVLIDVRTNRHNEALERVAELLRRRPGDSAGFSLRGDVLMAAGREADAAIAYAEAERRRPDAALAIKHYGARRAGGQPKPEEPLLRWLAIQPADYRVRMALADHYLSGSNFRQSASEFELILQQVPNNSAALNNLAWVYHQLRDSRAESVAVKAHELAPNSAAVADTLGWILVNKRQVDRALPLLERAARGAETDPQIQYHYAYALAAAGRNVEARAILTRALETKLAFSEREDAERLFSQLKG